VHALGCCFCAWCGRRTTNIVVPDRHRSPSTRLQASLVAQRPGGLTRNGHIDAARRIDDRGLRNQRSAFESSIDQRACCAASLRGCNELRSCNEKASFRISALHAALSTSRERHSKIFCNRKTIVVQIPAMTLVLSKTENGKQHAQ
jgi:hypothetical protein